LEQPFIDALQPCPAGTAVYCSGKPRPSRRRIDARPEQASAASLQRFSRLSLRIEKVSRTEKGQMWKGRGGLPGEAQSTRNAPAGCAVVRTFEQYPPAHRCEVVASGSTATTSPGLHPRWARS
jgi:hypothetical protein